MPPRWARRSSCRRRRAVESESPEPAASSIARATHRRRTLSPHPAGARDLSARNAATAIAVLEQLAPELRPGRKRSSADSRTWRSPDAWSSFPAHPAVLFDIAHNPRKRQSLVASLRETLSRAPRALRDRHRREQRRARDSVASWPAAGDVHLYVVRTVRTRAMARGALGDASRNRSGAGAARSPIRSKRFSVARRNAAADDIVVVTGSTFVVAALREWFARDRTFRPRRARGAGRAPGVGRAHVRHGHRQRHAGFVFRRRSRSRKRRALRAARQCVAGADLLDIGGESTRPGHRPVDDEIEIARVVPAIRATRERAARGADFRRHVQTRRVAARRTPPAPTW